MKGIIPELVPGVDLSHFNLGDATYHAVYTRTMGRISAFPVSDAVPTHKDINQVASSARGKINSFVVLVSEVCL